MGQRLQRLCSPFSNLPQHFDLQFSAIFISAKRSCCFCFFFFFLSFFFSSLLIRNSFDFAKIILFLNILNKNYCGFIAIELVTDNCWISRSNKYNPPRSSPIKLILSKIVLACASSSICSATYHCKKLCVE